MPSLPRNLLVVAVGLSTLVVATIALAITTLFLAIAGKMPGLAAVVTVTFHLVGLVIGLKNQGQRLSIGALFLLFPFLIVGRSE